MPNLDRFRKDMQALAQIGRVAEGGSVPLLALARGHRGSEADDGDNGESSDCRCVWMRLGTSGRGARVETRRRP